MSESAMTGTARLAEYAATFRYEQLPPEAVEAAKVIFLDTIGAMLLGSLPMYGSRLTAELARSAGGVSECTLVGRGWKTDVVMAALANGVLGYQADVEGAGCAGSTPRPFSSPSR